MDRSEEVVAGEADPGGPRDLDVGRARARAGSGAWLLLASGVAGLGVLAWLVSHYDAPFFTMHRAYDFVDLHARVANLTHLRRTGNIYVPFGHLAFTYPPGAILFFWPLLAVPAPHLATAWTLVSLVALAGTFAIVLVRLSTMSVAGALGVGCWAAAVAAAVFPEVTECLTYGQTGTILLFLVLADALIVRGPLRGVMVGVATAVKLYPAVFIVAWLLQRRWREAATAAGTAAVVTATSVALWSASGRTFFRSVLFGGEEYRRLTLPKNVKESSSVVAFFQRTPFHLHTLTPSEGTAVSALAVVVCLVAAHRVWRRGLPVTSVVVVSIAAAIGPPVAWDHYFVFLPLLVVVAWEAGPGSPLGVVAIAAAIVALVPWINFRAPRATTAWATTYSVVAQNALLVAVLAVVVAALSRRAGRAPGGPGVTAGP